MTQINGLTVIRLLLTAVVFNICMIMIRTDSCLNTEIKYITQTDCVGKTGTDFIMSTLGSATRADCAVKCDEMYQCMLFFYNSGAHSCSLHNQTLTDIAMINEVSSDCFVADDVAESWVVEVTSVSSNYASKPYSRLIGPSDWVEWAPEFPDQEDFVELRFASEMYMEQVHVYERYYTGGMSKISILAPNGTWCPVWITAGLVNDHDDRVTYPRLERTEFKTSKVRIDIGARTVHEQIDAVRVLGRQKLRTAIPVLMP